MAAFAVNCETLKKLTCYSCNFGTEGINAVLDHSSSLKELSVKRLVGGAAIPVRPGVVASSLKTIYIKELHNGQCFGPLIIGSKNLRTLKIFCCSGPGDWDKLLESIVKRVTGLTEIHLKTLLISDVGLAAISNCSNLEILHLANTRLCTTAGLVSIAGHCKLLRELHIHGWKKANRIGNEDRTAIAKWCPNLKELVLMNVNPTCFSLDLLAANCKNLERSAFWTIMLLSLEGRGARGINESSGRQL
ncbi:F-box protein At1g47056-like [Telopea speciosissima]|uniref:F-box protein At1g47056-like n=1 Tax=Telopea speciosissima TaxID=54955 RepID=UPI001CC37CD9|nr:F-box protein At1g47056-like [Telopea speciosissima]